jgi:cytidylate kinase
MNAARVDGPHFFCAVVLSSSEGYMPVIAMNQEMGSMGKDVAQALSEELGLAQVTHEVVDHVAEKMHARKSLIRRVMEGKAGMIDRMTTDSRSLSTYVAEEVYELAARGDTIIRGWGATYLLRAIPHVPCVRVCAPMEKRLQWMMKRLDTDDEELVRQELRRSDAAHTHNMHQRFGVTWGDPLLYDLVLNTDRLSVAGCVDQIKALLALPEFQETPESRRMLGNATLEAHVRAALRGDDDTDHVNISIAADAGVVSLEGIVVDEGERKAAVRVVGAVPGVVAVDERLKLISARMRDGE